MTIKRFEDIDAWKESRELVRLVYAAISESKQFRKDHRLANQIQSAAVSSMSNIAEGFSRKSNKEFIQFLFVSKSSSAEVQSHLYVALDQKYISVALDQKYISSDIFEKIYSQAEKVSKMDSGFIKYLKSQLNKPK